MASYKVPQDVEADDKLIGPFSFRQFIYLIIVALAATGAWGLSRLFLPLAIIPLPVIIFFGALALPLRKDQPMEIFMAAMLSFYLKPRRKMWDPDGIDSLIEITAPKTVDVQLTKDLSQDEARKRLNYLADVVDSRGWAVRGSDIQAPASSAMSTDAYFEAQDANDMLDNYNPTSQTLDYKLNQSDIQRHQDMIDIVNHKPIHQKQPIQQQIPVSMPIDEPSTIAPAQKPDPVVKYDPYPDIKQSVLEPIQYNAPQQVVQQPTNQELIYNQVKATSTSENVPNADIINLANNNDLSIETIAREASRINKKKNQEMNQEVIISLR